MRTIPDICVDFIAKWEGVRLTAYQDVASVWTIGYGHIAGVKAGDRITDDQARAFLRADLREAAGKLSARIGEVVDELTEHQYAALLSFVFNVGANPSWTIWKRLKRRDFDQVPLELMKFVNARDPKSGSLVKVKGLVNRRAAEVALWATDEPGSADIRLTSGHTRTGETPPTLADPVPPKKSATIWAAIAAPFLFAINWFKDLLSQAPDFVQTAIGVVNPFAGKSHVADWIIQGLGGLGAVAAVYVAFSAWRKKQEARS